MSILTFFKPQQKAASKCDADDVGDVFSTPKLKSTANKFVDLTGDDDSDSKNLPKITGGALHVGGVTVRLHGGDAGGAAGDEKLTLRGKVETKSTAPFTGFKRKSPESSPMVSCPRGLRAIGDTSGLVPVDSCSECNVTLPLATLAVHRKRGLCAGSAGGVGAVCSDVGNAKIGGAGGVNKKRDSDGDGCGGGGGGGTAAAGAGAGAGAGDGDSGHVGCVFGASDIEGLVARHVMPSGQTLCVTHGDLTDQTVDCVVNAANKRLRHAGGLAAALSRKAGSVLQQASDVIISKRGRLSVGEAVVTDSGSLPCACVIHTVGPIWGSDKDGVGGDADALLAKAVYSALRRAHERNYKSIALPAISSGIYGYPKPRCARVMVTAVTKWCLKYPESSVRDVRFTNFDKPTVKVFEDEFVTQFNRRFT